MPREIPKIIHFIWIGGGNLATVKSLDGLNSWLGEKDYELWIWWDDAHMFSIPARKEMSGSREKREDYERDLKMGRDIHNLRFLAGTKGPQEKLDLAVDLINKMRENFQCIRDLAKRYPDRIKLCNIRSHEYLPNAPGSTMEWTNRDLFDVEMSRRGVFPAAASDILRYEILYNYGGVYLDVDLEMREPLKTLTVEKDLALCGYINSFKRNELNQPLNPKEALKLRRKEFCTQPYHEATKVTHKGECFYAQNGILATHAKSRFVDLLRRSIRVGYRHMGFAGGAQPAYSDEEQLLKRYWETVINKSTLDLTGPNLVRDIQYCLFRGFNPDQIPDITINRLMWELKAHPDPEHWGIDDHPDMAVMSYPRNAELWRDDDPAYYGFYNWVSRTTWFPIHCIRWETEASLKSDTRAAKLQSFGRTEPDTRGSSDTRGSKEEKAWVGKKV
jgi:hypothetical protein